MNKLKETARILGIDLGQEFYTDRNHHKYKLTVNGIYKLDGTAWEKESYMLILLLTGEVKIISQPILKEDEKTLLKGICNYYKEIKYIKKACRQRNGVGLSNSLLFYDKDENQLANLPIFAYDSEDFIGVKANKYYKIEELGVNE